MKYLIKKYLYIPIIVLFICSFDLFGQGNGYTLSILPPSPEASALGRFSLIPVNLYSGIPSINIPLFELARKDLKLSISLSYHASGVRVEDKSSWVGTNWALNAGGIITRTIYGDDDLTGNYFQDNWIIDQVNPGIMSMTYQNDRCEYNGADPDLNNYLNQVNNYQNIFAPDVFYYNFCGHIGKFIISQLGAFIVIGQKSNIKIEFINQTLKSDGFKITTPDGFIYTFSVRNRTVPFSGNSYISSWNLTLIESPLKETVHFEYNYDQSVHHGYFKRVLFKDTEFNGYFLRDQVEDVTAFYNFKNKCYGNPSQSVTLYSTYVSEEHLLSKITLENGQKEIIFNATKDRNDALDPSSQLPEAYKLNSISFLTRTFNFSYDNNPNHLLLKEVGEFGLRPYKFDYYSHINGSGKDHWGFLTKHGETHEPDAEYMKSDALYKITYPTGGYTEFEFEPHTFNQPELTLAELQNPIVSNQARIENFQYYQNISNATCPSGSTLGSFSTARLSNNQVVNYQLCRKQTLFNISGSEDMVVDFEYFFQGNPLPEPPDAGRITTLGNDLKIDFDGVLNCSGSSCGSQKKQLTLKPGDHYMYVEIPPDIPFTAEVKITYNKKRIVGGLRVKKILDSDGINSGNDISRKYFYGDEITNVLNQKVEGQSYGLRMTSFNYIVPYSRALTGTNWVGTPPNNLQSIIGTCSCSRNEYYEESTVPLSNSAQGSHIGYSKVIEVYGENGRNGRTIYEYRNNPDIPFGLIFPGLPNLAFSDNGLIEKKTVYNDDTNIVYEIDYNYGNKLSNYYEAVIFNRDPFSEYFYSIYYDQCKPGLTDGYSYRYPIKWDPLISTIEKHYNSNESGGYTTVETTYQYDNSVHMLPTKISTVSSTDKILTKQISYVADFNINSGFIQNLKNYFMHNLPIEEIIYQTNIDGSNRKVVDGKLTVYNSNSKGLKSIEYLIETNNAISPDQFQFAKDLSIQDFVFDNSKFKPKLFYDDYDLASNNIRQTHYADNHNVSYIWAYNNTYPVVKIENITYGDISTSIKTNITNRNFTSNTDRVSVKIDVDFLKAQLSTLMIDPRYKVTFYTYSPLVGMTSETDPNGVTTYYEYDGFGRLKLVKDDDGNILKTYDYHYKE